MVSLDRLRFCADPLLQVRPLFQTRGIARAVVRAYLVCALQAAASLRHKELSTLRAGYLGLRPVRPPQPSPVAGDESYAHFLWL